MAPNEFQTNGATAHDIAPIETLKIVTSLSMIKTHSKQSNPPVDGIIYEGDPHLHAKGVRFLLEYTLTIQAHKLKVPVRYSNWHY
jgi:hypothetical protein